MPDSEKVCHMFLSGSRELLDSHHLSEDVDMLEWPKKAMRNFDPNATPE
jgi:hypothetical protein